MRRQRASVRETGASPVSRWMRPARLAAAVLAAGFALSTAVSAVLPASAAADVALRGAADNPYQRGPDPTITMIESSRGPFATASVSVPPGNGFNGGMIYYPTD